MVNEDAPKISLDLDFESNHAFFFALFVLLAAAGWAVRDHRRRALQVMVAQQEDRLYMTVLSILFVICIFGAYYAFRRQVSGRIFENPVEAPLLQRRLEEAMAQKLMEAEIEEAEMQNDPIRIAFILGGGACIASVFLFVLWFIAKRNEEAKVQAAFAPRQQQQAMQGQQ